MPRMHADMFRCRKVSLQDDAEQEDANVRGGRLFLHSVATRVASQDHVGMSGLPACVLPVDPDRAQKRVLICLLEALQC